MADESDFSAQAIEDKLRSLRGELDELKNAMQSSGQPDSAPGSQSPCEYARHEIEELQASLQRAGDRPRTAEEDGDRPSRGVFFEKNDLTKMLLTLLLGATTLSGWIYGQSSPPGESRAISQDPAAGSQNLRAESYMVRRPVYETTMREEKYTVKRPVKETKFREEEYTVMRPVKETTIREDEYTVMQPIKETDFREEEYTVQVPVFETVMYEQREKVLKLVCERCTPGRMPVQVFNETVEVRQVPVQTLLRYDEETRVRKVPIETVRYVEKTKVRKVPVETVRYVEDTKVRKVPVETVRYEEEEKVRMVPVETVRYVEEERVRMVP